MRSYPFVVRLSQIDKLNSSLRVLERSYMLEIMHQMHIDFLGKAIENLGGLITCHPNRVQLNSFESGITLRIL